MFAQNQEIFGATPKFAILDGLSDQGGGVIGGRGRAALLLQGINVAIIKNAAGRRQGHRARDGEGARAPAGIAHRRVETVVLTERRAGGVENGPRGPRPALLDSPVTPLGYTTAVRARAQALACLDASDPKRRAADMLADACERIGSVGGGAIGGGSDTSGGISDGGVTTKIKHAARLRIAEAIANGWRVDPVHGPVRGAADRVVLPVRRKIGNRQEIKAFPLLVALCVDGQDMNKILLAHGWSAHGKHIKVLINAAWAMLDDLAAAWGFGA